MRFNLAIARDDPERVAQTEAVCRQLVEARPNLPEAHNGLGVALQRQNRLDEALASYRKASALQPGYVQSSVNESLILLLLGRYEEAWPKYEWRRRLSTMRRVERTQPLWQGNEIASKTILLHSEQGFGDSLQFMRYVPLVAERARHVILEVPRALVRLAASLPIDNLTIVPNDLTPPAADLQCPLMGLPRIFGTRADSIPGRVPYLSPRRPIVERWSKILGGDPRLKVGIVWAGSIAHKGDRSRSIALERLAPLFALNGVAWHSLQVGPPAKDVDRLAQGAIVDLSSRLGDFAETAGALLNLDLLVAVDTAVAHLGGALARPTWIMLPFAPDWRWMLEREDSPWYPTVRLFRQPSPGDWDSVIARIGRALAEWISRRHGVAI
jgi:tetratricopeptide (TPR) repeat protein